MLITLTAARAGTGVTTTAVGLAAAWPRPVLLVEADPCGYSTILAGTLGATVPVGPGLLDAAMAARSGELELLSPTPAVVGLLHEAHIHGTAGLPDADDPGSGLAWDGSPFGGRPGPRGR